MEEGAHETTVVVTHKDTRQVKFNLVPASSPQKEASSALLGIGQEHVHMQHRKGAEKNKSPMLLHVLSQAFELRPIGK